MIPQPDRAALIKSFTDMELPEKTAEEMADELLAELSVTQPGLMLHGVDAHEIPILVQRATRAGAKNLTLKISCTPESQTDWHHFAVEVVALERWEG
jgi:hypothetical protein